MKKENDKIYLDLLLFEHRLKQNMKRFNRARFAWKVFIITWIFLFAFLTFVTSSSFVLIFITSLIILLSTGILQRHIFTTEQYQQTCNRTLKPFNMKLSKSGLQFSDAVPKHFKASFEKIKLDNIEYL